MRAPIPKRGLLAAPLAGVSNPVYRSWAARFGADVAFTEMISAEGLRRNQRKTLDLARYYPLDIPCGAQLFDDEPEPIAEAAPIIEEMGYEFLDINMGCPARKVTKKGAGSALMASPELAASIVSAARSAVDIPVSCKIRSGFHRRDEYIDLIPALVSAGADFITIHARSAAQLFGGSADWNIIARAVEISEVPVIGNGDIINPEDAPRMLEETGCHAVMIGRASMGNPWIFRRASRALQGREIPSPPDYEEILDGCGEYVADLVELYGERRAIPLSRKHVAWFTKGIPGAKEIRTGAFGAETLDEMLDILRQGKEEVCRLTA